MKFALEVLSKREHQLRPILLKLLGPKRFIGLYSKLRPSMLKMLSRVKFETKTPMRPYQQWGLTFRNDVGNAAGLDKDGSLLEFNYRLGAGFAVVGTVLHKPHTGNLYPMMGAQLNPWTPLPSSHSAINSLGLPGHGIEPVLERIKSFKSKFSTGNFPVGLSVMGHPKEEGEEKIKGVESCIKQSISLVDFIEINESCPNVQHHDLSALAQRVERFCAIRNELKPDLPLWFKFSHCPDEETMCMLNNYNVQAVILTNTQTNYSELSKNLNSEDKNLFTNYTDNYKGGMSGKIIQSSSRNEIEKASTIISERQLAIKLIHVGGLSNFPDMEDSRKIAPLREWYSGLMESMGRLPLEFIYPSLF